MVTEFLVDFAGAFEGDITCKNTKASFYCIMDVLFSLLELQHCRVIAKLQIHLGITFICDIISCTEEVLTEEGVSLVVEEGVVENRWESNQGLNLLSKSLTRTWDGSFCLVQKCDPQHGKANPPEPVKGILSVVVPQVEINPTCVAQT